MKIEALRIYPIKGCGHLELTEMFLGTSGPEAKTESQTIGDREWVLIDEKGVFLSQRTDPRLATVTCAVTKQNLQIQIPSIASFDLPSKKNSDRVDASVWSSVVSASLENQKVHQAFSDFLGKEVRLCRFDETSRREASSKGVGLGVQVRFSDAQQILVINLASLQDLNRQLVTPIPFDRFRPNIVLSSENAWDEDRWTRLQVRSLELEAVKPCGRCVVITIDQKTGVSPSKEPLKVLSSFRKIGNSVAFGQYYLSRTGGSIRVGDQITG